MRSMIAAVSMLACSTALGQDVTADKLGWMSGCWAASGGETGSGEQWMAPAGGTLIGMSRTVKNGKTVAWEAVQIRDVDGKLAYVAKPHNQPEAAFKLASLDGQHVVFENPQHDFPQRIIYKRDGDRLLARVEGTMKGKTKGIEFPLQKTACPGN